MKIRAFPFLLPCFLSLLAIASVASVQGQADTLTLEVVEITAPRMEGIAEVELVKSWSEKDLQSYRNTHLADLLDQAGGLFIKSYGIGSLSTSAVRGGSAGHTAILWNGLPINSPMLGLQDLALLPVSFTDQVQLHYGGGSASWGSGAIGGSIGLSTLAPESGWRINLGAELGSFGRDGQQAVVRYGGKNWGVQSRYFRLAAKNDFPFRTSAGDDQRLEHAAIRQSGSLSELFWRPKPRHQLSLHFWRQSVSRELPPTTTQTRSLATQDDAILRLAAQWQYRGDHWLWQHRAGYFQEEIYYSDPAILLEAPSDFHTLIQEVNLQRPIGATFLFLLGGQYQYVSAKATGYPNGNSQHRVALFSSLRWQFAPTGKARLAVRQERIANQWTWPTPSISLAWSATNWLHWQAKVSRNFRFPTLNDLYWQPGGNPDLLPESGWSQELSARIAADSLESFSYELVLTAFNRRINNWILWSRPNGQMFWSSNNIARVWSRGFSPRFSSLSRFGPLSLRWELGYDWIKSTNQIAIELPKLSVGEQLWYVPIHRAWSSIELAGKHWSVQYQHQYTGASAGINEDLENYQVSHARGSYLLYRKHYKIHLLVQVFNLWDSDYRVIERRPMPGRHFRLGLQFELSPSNQP